jgi:hypothetical protein
VEHSLSDFSAETRPAWVTLPVATLLLAQANISGKVLFSDYGSL